MKRVFHVHVYKIPEKAEIDISAKSDEEAMKEALSMAKKGFLKFSESDNRFMAVPFETINIENKD